jgi:pimeloyl-ACP methyl ester carboxylesterase
MHQSQPFFSAITIGLLTAALGCATSVTPLPDMGGIYNRAARWRDDQRNPVIVIPGVLGSKLVDPESRRVVWGAFLGSYANPNSADGAGLVALPMRRGVPLRELRDEVVPDGVLESVRVSLFGLPVEQQAYVSILRTLGVGGYRDQQLAEAGAIDYGSDHFTCFQFDYDWRRDNVENARRLHDFIVEKRAYVKRQLRERYGIERDDLRFDIVAHSMGGLLARYYLRYGTADLPEDGSPPPVTWEGAENVERLVLVGTPNAGSLTSLKDLVEGTKLSFVLPRYAPALIGSMPAIYQLLPRTRHRAVFDEVGAPVDVFDPKVWSRFGWGLASTDAAPVLAQMLPHVGDEAERRSIALDHLAKSLKRARRFHAALDVPTAPPSGTVLHLFAGDARPTPAVMQVSNAGTLRVVALGPGDDTVLRTSATMDERVGRPEEEWAPGLVSPIAWRDISFVFTDHLAMTRDPSFTDNVLYRLLDAPPPVAAAPSVRQPAPGTW